MSNTVPFTYREFYDIPRAILLTHRGRWLYMTCPFDEEVDEYAPTYNVYELPAAVARKLTSEPPAETVSSWIDIERFGVFMGVVPTAEITFDSTRRRNLDPTPLDVILDRSIS
jgi:hypothetical protein